ncbi:MAG: nitroreductase family protein, partial [Candidatus Bathyarchaeia archaeon]
RTTGRYGERGVRYVHMEAGHAAEIIYFQCVSLGLGTVVVGAFIDEQVQRLLNLPENCKPLYLIPVGKKLATS